MGKLRKLADVDLDLRGWIWLYVHINLKVTGISRANEKVLGMMKA